MCKCSLLNIILYKHYKIDPVCLQNKVRDDWFLYQPGSNILEYFKQLFLFIQSKAFWQSIKRTHTSSLIVIILILPETKLIYKYVLGFSILLSTTWFFRHAKSSSRYHTINIFLSSFQLNKFRFLVGSGTQIKNSLTQLNANKRNKCHFRLYSM